MTGVVLAGGQGRRLGRPKAQVQVGEQPIIRRILNIITPLFDELLIVADNTEGLEELGVRVVADIIPGKGSLGGIYSGLCQAPSSRIFCVACDMPFLDAALIKHMLGNCSDSDALIPEYNGKLHPLHAIYNQDCKEPIHRQLTSGDLKITNFFPQVRVGYVAQEKIKQLNPAGYALFNVNTRRDLKIAGRISH